VLPPAEAKACAAWLAPALTAASRKAIYVDCNAVSPATATEVAAIIAPTGAVFVDGGIIGGPPREDGYTPVLYVSGPEAERLAPLRDHGLDVRVTPGPIGAASALKMSYAGITKGLVALSSAMMLAATRAGAAEGFRAELARSQPQLLAWFGRMVPPMPDKAYRWVGEMEEIAATFAAVGLTPRMLEGAADMYRFVAETPLGRETPETRDTSRDAYGLVTALADSLEKRGA
jgi:3-hydroxyisobutyrate dehydrogenase-like beta-hydroxyacid dehydrogenase